MLTLQQLDSDAIACGLLKKLKTVKFLGTIYLLSVVLPILSQLSRTFQKGSASFSLIKPQIALAKGKLQDALQTDRVMEELQADLDSYTSLTDELVMSSKQHQELYNLQRKYITCLQTNINDRFSDMSGILEGFSVFDPMAVPETSSPAFKEYGQGYIKTLGEHFFHVFEGSDTLQEKLLAEWQAFKYMINDHIKDQIPETVKRGTECITTTEWFVSELMKRRSAYIHFCPLILQIAETVATLPVSNAWPERGASALKLTKTRCRNRLKNDMLECLLHVLINGPPTGDKAATAIIQSAVESWDADKRRRKKPKKPHPVMTVENESSESSAEDDVEAVVVEEQDVAIVSSEHHLDAIQTEVNSLCSMLDLATLDGEETDTDSD